MDINVFVCHDRDFDFSAAERYLQGNGKIINFFEGLLNPHKTGTIQRQIVEVAKKMSPNDYLLICGNSVLCSLITAYMYADFGHLNLLTWEYKDREYVSSKIDFDNI